MEIKWHFIFFVMKRYFLILFAYGTFFSLFSGFIFKMNPYLPCFIVVFLSPFILLMSFAGGVPYYNCKNGIHWIVINGNFGSEHYKCIMCDYDIPVKYKEVKIKVRIIPEEFK